MGQVADKSGILTDRNPQDLMIACGWQVLSDNELRSRTRADPLQKTAERQRAQVN
jgi:hypothetical protein